MARKAQETHNRFCFTVLTVFMVLAVVCAGFFVFAGLDHDCTGDDCHICLELRLARSLFEGLSLAVFLTAVAAAGAQGFFKIAPLFYAALPTPVSLKTKYNS